MPINKDIRPSGSRISTSEAATVKSASADGTRPYNHLDVPTPDLPTPTLGGGRSLPHTKSAVRPFRKQMVYPIESWLEMLGLKCGRVSAYLKKRAARERRIFIRSLSVRYK